jgi:putative membrane protein
VASGRFPTPWYASYAATTGPWHLEPLADQQLAGVISWVPAGFVYRAAALALPVV